MSYFDTLIALSSVAAGMIIGILLFLRPAAAIEIQRHFYEKINWRIEPVSMTKELRTTRAMGLGLAGISLAVLIYLTIFKLICR
jgi:hypothetical protein